MKKLKCDTCGRNATTKVISSTGRLVGCYCDKDCREWAGIVGYTYEVSSIGFYRLSGKPIQQSEVKT